MVLTRNSCVSENFRKSKRILRDIKHQQQLRPRVSIPDYREESPDEIAYFRNILKVDIKNKNSLSHKLRIGTDNTKKTYKEIHRYELRASATDNNKCEVNHSVDCLPASVHESELNTDNNKTEHVSINKEDHVTLPHSLSVNPTVEIHESTPKKTSIFDVNKCKRTFKRRLTSSFNKHSDLDNSQICYEDDRRYPIRLRRRPREVYMVNTAYKSGKKANWHEPLDSPIRNCYATSHHKKLEVYSKESDTDDSDGIINDEIKFENRKQRSIQRARLELKPINMSGNEMKMDLFNERALARSSLADIEPMIIDKTITFDMVGGNKSCIQSLKESVILPLIYPEVFEKLSISPPRGLLFYGSPGSGKTLMARALVNECGNSGTCKISFFMRKGADCLSKWVGESERQLRLLFDQAYRMRPSIIFFDEIDGLAPVRSARQDQIHSSIVSTLLSLIDGLDDRGQIIVIGATNRLDAIDPALRRPGRFDREFLFTLPEEDVRKDILRIHTKNWQYPLSDVLVEELASITKGYSGADLKGLIIEAGLCALRRRYPQIYKSQKKLQLNIKEIYVKEGDFKAALKIIRPSNERSALPVHSKIPQRIRVLIGPQYSIVKEKISQLFQESVFTSDSVHLSKSSTFSSIFKLRLHVSGYEVDNIVSGIFHDIHNVNIYVFDSLYMGTNTGLSTEEKLSHLFREANKTPKSIIYFPHLDIIFHGMCLSAQNMLLSLINGTVPNSDFNASNILILVTLSSYVNYTWCNAEFDHSQSENIWQQLGQCFHSSTVTIDRPSVEQRTMYFSQLIKLVMEPVKGDRNILSESIALVEEELKEIEIKPLSLSKVELDKLEIEEDNILRKFRILLRQILANIAKDRKFQIFHNPVDESEVPDYYTIIKNPMDLSTMRQKIDLYNYYTFDELKNDLNLISANALLYNPAANSYLRDIRRHAYEFNDIAHSIFEEHLNPEFSKMVSDIHQSRIKRCYYEKKKQSLAQQSSDMLDFLTDLNGSKYEVNNGPLLKSQIDMYNNFYSKSLKKTKISTKAHSDSETIVTRTSLNDSVKCKSLCDVTDADQSTEMIKMTFKSFKQLTKSFENDVGADAKEQEHSDESLNESYTLEEEEVLSEPVIIDYGELNTVFKYVGLKSDKWTIFQLESLYCLISAEIDKYGTMVDKTGLARNLRSIADSYSGSVI